MRAQADDAAGGNAGQIRAMPEFLAREYVAQMNLDERYGHGEKRVAQRDARVREGAGIDDRECNAVLLRA